MAVTPEGCRAGRAILKWSMRELARQSGVAWTTIHRIEGGAVPRAGTAGKIAAAFAGRGVTLIGEGGLAGAVQVRAKPS